MYGITEQDHLTMSQHPRKAVALDLFAGSGWGVACQWLGIEEHGVELMPEARATREANGMDTIYHDVWDGLSGVAEVPAYNLLIASPPCQTFSLAGKGSGRAALDDVLSLIAEGAYTLPGDGLRQLAKSRGLDDRTALVLSPLAQAYRDRPELIAFEQVPTVLPVWEACAEVLRLLGYSVATGNVYAEQYGVPQTRKRAILLARRDGREAKLPTPTHSRYYSRTPEKLDEGVLPWVSMAEALGWTGSDATRFTQNNKLAHQAHRPLNTPAPTVTAGHDSGNRGFIDGEDFRVATPDEVATLQTYPSGIYVHPLSNGRRGVWSTDEPAPTIRGVNRPMPATYKGHERDACAPADAHKRLSADEAATLQTYPISLVGFPRRADSADSVEINGEQYRARDLRASDQPSQTITEKARSWSEFAEDGTRRPISTDEAAAIQTYPSTAWGFTNRPAVTAGNAVGRGLGGGSGAFNTVKSAIADGTFIPSIHAKSDAYAEVTRITVEEAGVIQSYERPFKFAGTKTKQFLQIGNAVPPVLAHAILSELLS